jgi:hypothetical protein
VIDQEYAALQAAVSSSGSPAFAAAAAAAAARPCWVCRGSGCTSRWLGSAAIKVITAKLDARATASIATAASGGGGVQVKGDRCCLCGEASDYGMAVDCGKHTFCRQCITTTLATALNAKQFPLQCPQCVRDAEGTGFGSFSDAVAASASAPAPADIPTITESALSFMCYRGIISKEVRGSSLSSSQHPLATSAMPRRYGALSSLAATTP